MLVLLVSAFEYLITPEFQLLFWGSACVSVFIYTLLKAFDEESEDRILRLTAATTMNFVWINNIANWYTNTAVVMTLVDALFAIVWIAIYYQRRERWLFEISVLYTLAVLLDLCLIKGMLWYEYAIAANILFGRQLYIVSGFQFKQTKTNG